MHLRCERCLIQTVFLHILYTRMYVSIHTFKYIKLVACKGSAITKKVKPNFS